MGRTFSLLAYFHFLLGLNPWSWRHYFSVVDSLIWFDQGLQWILVFICKHIHPYFLRKDFKQKFFISGVLFSHQICLYTFLFQYAKFTRQPFYIDFLPSLFTSFSDFVTVTWIVKTFFKSIKWEVWVSFLIILDFSTGSDSSEG